MKEFSYFFKQDKLGIGLTSASQRMLHNGTYLKTAVVSYFKKHEHESSSETGTATAEIDFDIMPGDILSRIQGVSVTGMQFDGMYVYIFIFM